MARRVGYRPRGEQKGVLGSHRLETPRGLKPGCAGEFPAPTPARAVETKQFTSLADPPRRVVGFQTPSLASHWRERIRAQCR